jgi:hypothetical protein
MNAIRQALEQFLASSTTEQLQAELTKGYRPLLQKLDDPVFLVEDPMFTFPATVSFFQGEFDQDQTPEVIDTAAPAYATCDAVGGFALAA